MNASQRIALVTGSNRGIGREIARGLAVQGWKVFGGYRGTFADPPEGVTPLKLDITDTASIKSAVAEVLKSGDHLDVLVNNAGILLDQGTSSRALSADDLCKTLETNTIAPLLVAQAFLPLLQKSDDARIINISSGGGQLAYMADSTWAPAYQISKTALNAVTCLLAGDLLPDGIAVNSVCPGWVRTDMGGAGATRSVEEGADTPIWLATKASRELTGKFFRDREEIPW